MALTHHADVELMQGDDWSIPGTLLDVDGAPLDLTNATLSWALVGPDGNGVETAEAAANITVNDPKTAGSITIILPRSITEGLIVGRYFDSLRVIIGLVSTLWVGQILVDADPSSV